MECVPDGVREDSLGVGTSGGADPLDLPVTLVARALAVVQVVVVIPGTHHQVEVGAVLQGRLELVLADRKTWKEKIIPIKSLSRGE